MAKDCCWNCRYFIPPQRNVAGELVAIYGEICTLKRNKNIPPSTDGLTEGDKCVRSDFRCKFYEERDYYRETSQRVCKALFNRCEEEGVTSEVGPEYYQEFLDLPDEIMKIFIFRILGDRGEEINRKLEAEEWESDEEMFDYIKQFLFFLSRGIMGFNEEKRCLVMSKPVGPKPDEVMEHKLEEKIAGTDNLIQEALIHCTQGNDKESEPESDESTKDGHS